MIKSYLNAPKLTIACLIALVLANAPHAYGAGTSEAATQLAHDEGDADASSHDLVQGSHVEGHIAFLKAELQITPDQESLWEPVAAAMREDVKNLQDADMRVEKDHSGRTAIGYLENRVLFASLRAQGEQRFLDAFRPLYAVLSRQQKEIAQELLIPNAPQ